MLLKRPSQDFRGFGRNPFSPFRRGLYRVRGSSLEQLRGQVQLSCQKRPGVYGMLDENGTLAYVGKSKSLRDRLLTYFLPANREEKAGRIIRDAVEIVWELNPTEFSALLREQQLIRKFQPRYNSAGQPNRQRPTYILLEGAVAPAITSGRQPKPGLFCGGPVMGARRAGLAVESLNRFFKLRDCSSTQPLTFTDQQSLFDVHRRAGCLRAELGNCLAPCIAACSRREYDRAVAEAKAFLHGDNEAPIEHLTAEMQLAAAQGNFEYAARVRDTLNAVIWLRERLVGLARAEHEFTFVYPIQGPTGTSYWYLVRRGLVCGTFSAPSRRVPGDRVSRRLDDRLDDLAEQLAGPPDGQKCSSPGRSTCYDRLNQRVVYQTSRRIEKDPHPPGGSRHLRAISPRVTTRTIALAILVMAIIDAESEPPEPADDNGKGAEAPRQSAAPANEPTGATTSGDETSVLHSGHPTAVAAHQPLPSPTAEMLTFLRLRGLTLSATLRAAFGDSRLRMALLIWLCGIFWVGLFWIFREGFYLLHNVLEHPGMRTANVFRIYNVFFLALTVMLTISSAIILYGGLFRSDSTNFLLTTPTSSRQIVMTKFSEAAVFSGWGFFLLGTPMLVAYGVEFLAPTSYFLLIVPLLAAFTLVPTSLGGLLCW